MWFSSGFFYHYRINNLYILCRIFLQTLLPIVTDKIIKNKTIKYLNLLLSITVYQQN